MQKRAHRPDPSGGHWLHRGLPRGLPGAAHPEVVGVSGTSRAQRRCPRAGRDPCSPCVAWVGVGSLRGPASPWVWGGASGVRGGNAGEGPSQSTRNRQDMGGERGDSRSPGSGAERAQGGRQRTLLSRLNASREPLLPSEHGTRDLGGAEQAPLPASHFCFCRSLLRKRRRHHIACQSSTGPSCSWTNCL